MTDSKLNAQPGRHDVTGSPAELNVIGRLVEQYRGGQLDPARLVATGTVRNRLATDVGQPPTQTIRLASIPSQAAVGQPSVVQYPTVLLQAAIVNLGDQTSDGPLVEGVSIAWVEIVSKLGTNPAYL